MEPLFEIVGTNEVVSSNAMVPVCSRYAEEVFVKDMVFKETSPVVIVKTVALSPKIAVSSEPGGPAGFQLVDVLQSLVVEWHDSGWGETGLGWPLGSL